MPIAPGAVSMQALPRRPPPSQENVVSSSSSAAPAARRPIPISQSTDSYFVAARRIQPPSLALASARGLPTIDSLPLLPEEPEAHELSAGDRRSSGERLSAAQGGISLPSAWVHQVKGNIGPGCLALPCVFARIGPALGVPLVLAVTIPGGYAMLVLVRLKRALCEAGHPVMAYEDVAAVAFGPSGRRLLEWVIMTLQLGISTVYVDIVSAAFRAGAPALRGPVWVALLPCVPLFFGLSLIADIKALLPFSLPGFLIMLTACVGAVAQAAVQMGWLDALGGAGAAGGGGDAAPAAAPAFSRPPYDYNALDVATFIGATFYASESICLVLPIETALSADAADPARRCCNFYSTFALAFATAIVAYASVGAMCGHAFPDASGSIVAYLTRVNPGSPFWQTVNVLIGAAVAATFPLQLLPAIAPLEANCCPLTVSDTTRAAADDDGGDEHSSWPELMRRATAVATLPSKRQRNVADSRKPDPSTETRVPPDTGPAGGTSSLTYRAECTYRLPPLRSGVPCMDSSMLDQPVGRAGGDTQRTPSVLCADAGDRAADETPKRH